MRPPLPMPKMPLDTHLEGGRFDGKKITTDTIPAKIVVPFMLGTPNPYPDILWVDDNGCGVSPPLPAATYGLRQRGPDDNPEWYYEFVSEKTAEHWTPETFAAEMARRREMDS